MLEFQNQHLESAERIARSILRVNSKDVLALQVQGLCLAMQGRAEESVELFAKAATLDAKNPELLTNLAKAQHQAGLYTDAVKTFEKLKRLTPNNPQILTDMGTAYAKLKQYDKASSCYERALELQPDYYLAWSNRGNLLAELQQPREALASFDKALSFNPQYPETWTNKGNAFFSLGQLEEALACHQQALYLNPNYAEALSNCANTLTALNRNEHALECNRKAYSLKPDHPYLLGHLLSGERGFCNWQIKHPTDDLLFNSIVKNIPASIPFNLLSTEATLDLQKLCAEIFVKDKASSVSQSPPLVKNKLANRKIKLAYFSADFRNHPVGILMDNLVLGHDRNRYEVIGYFLNRATGDLVESHLLKIFDKTFNLSGLDDSEAYDLVLQEGIDIAVDLNVHTADGRLSLFAKRLAPIQINYLGYAGTSGADFYDCLIADKVAIPLDHQVHYTERIAYLPHSFFPVDTSIAPEQFGDLPTRSSQGLPSTGYIFACFNNSYKINPLIFSIWMDLLKQVPGSVLWLSKASNNAIENLQRESQARGVDPSRLVFATRVPARVDHLSRLRLADLFLDTPNYNAHATAADALWAGVPVLTILGQTFAGRVAASQVSALGLPELIVHSVEEYRAKALELAQHPEQLKELKERLENNRYQAPLFNTRQYVKDLESLYASFLE
jgi:predicted O-linked N-acetylglucosamine transferase (SPINDLY family)